MTQSAIARSSSYSQRYKVGARLIRRYIDKSLKQYAEWKGITPEQEKACDEAAQSIIGSIVHTVEIDTEQASHFACWFVNHIVEKGAVSAIDRILFATYLNTAEIRDKSGYLDHYMDPTGAY
jgi:hypothetical protein